MSAPSGWSMSAASAGVVLMMPFIAPWGANASVTCSVITVAMVRVRPLLAIYEVAYSYWMTEDGKRRET